MSTMLEPIIIKRHNLLPFVYGRVEIDEKEWRDRVIRAVEMALKAANISWRDDLVMHFKVVKLPLLETTSIFVRDESRHT